VFFPRTFFVRNVFLSLFSSFPGVRHHHSYPCTCSFLHSHATLRLYISNQTSSFADEGVLVSSVKTHSIYKRGRSMVSSMWCYALYPLMLVNHPTQPNQTPRFPTITSAWSACFVAPVLCCAKTSFGCHGSDACTPQAFRTVHIQEHAAKRAETINAYETRAREERG
jgi:hypothetical protein